MDALAAYGSDDESSSSVVSNCGGDDDDVTPAKKTTNKPTTTTLLASYGESDSDSNDEKEEPLPPATKRQKTDHTSPSKTAAAAEPLILPPPPLSNKSLIHWTVDHSKKYRQPTAPDSLVDTKLADKLNHLKQQQQQQQQSTISWASHLWSQHEFHNPRFIHNAVSYFGIEEPLACHSLVTDWQLYERNIVQAEEQARIRQGAQQQQQDQA